MKRIIPLFLCAVIVLSGCGKYDAELQTEPSYYSAPTQESSSEKSTENIEKIYNVTGKCIVIDAGHGISSYNKQEAVAPNASETKIAFSYGTSGANQTEEQLNLSVALKLRSILEEMGAEIHMTRTEHESDMTNIDRAELANSLNADLTVRIHADGNENKSIHGVSVLVPGTQYIADSDLIEKSRISAECVLDEFVKTTGANNRGIYVRNDLTGFNWSKVPVILIEMGFMTNSDEDKLMETEDYQNKIVQGIVNGLERYFTN